MSKKEIVVTVTYTLERIRQIGNSFRTSDEFSTAHAEAFMILYADKLKEVMESAAGGFISGRIDMGDYQAYQIRQLKERND